VGHLAVARAAQRKFRLHEIHFVPAGRHPLKTRQPLAAFPHRYAMVALACAEHPGFVPSLAEAGEDHSGQHIFYSIDTVRHFRRLLRHPHDRLYFVVGADAFLDIPKWRDYEVLLQSCDFIVVSRPGFRMQALRLVVPPELLARPRPGAAHERQAIPLRRSTVHLLDSVMSHVSSTEIRRRRQRHLSIHGLVPLGVEEYILKQALYT
jgi:nicotinate-nucleotide adenylyltransferase